MRITTKEFESLGWIVAVLGIFLALIGAYKTFGIFERVGTEPSIPALMTILMTMLPGAAIGLAGAITVLLARTAHTSAITAEMTQEMLALVRGNQPHFVEGSKIQDVDEQPAQEDAPIQKWSTDERLSRVKVYKGHLISRDAATGEMVVVDNRFGGILQAEKYIDGLVAT